MHKMDKTEALSRRQIESRAGEAWASWYWARRSGKPKTERVAAILAYRFYRAWSQTGPFTIERNDRGNRVYRDSDADRQLGIGAGGSRYAYDFRADWLTTWQQYDTDQDANYFGVWVDVKGMRTFTFAEGDRILVECDNSAAFAAELADMATFYGDPPAAFTTIDLDGTVTRYYDERPVVASA